MNDNTATNNSSIQDELSIGARDPPIQAAIIDSANYHDQEDWFRLLQEDGFGFSDVDVATWEKNPKKKKSVHITFRRKHYRQLYKLAQSIFVLYNSNKKEGLFLNILKNKSDAIHKIGLFIAKNRYSKAKGDIHSIIQGFDYKQFASKSEYDTRTIFYFLDQGMVLKHFLDMWSGRTMKEKVKPIDSIRFQEDMREDVSYALSEQDRSDRLTLDQAIAQSSSQRAEMMEALTILILSVTKDRSNDNNDSISNKIAAIDRTHSTINKFEFTLDELNEKKRKLRQRYNRNSSALQSGKKKKQKKIDDYIKLTKTGVKILNKALELQLSELNKMNHKDNEEESDDSSSDESDDDSDDLSDLEQQSN